MERECAQTPKSLKKPTSCWNDAQISSLRSKVEAGLHPIDITLGLKKYYVTRQVTFNISWSKSLLLFFQQNNACLLYSYEHNVKSKSVFCDLLIQA